MLKYFLLSVLLSATAYSQVLEEDNKVYTALEVDEKPEFIGGINQFFKYVAKNFKVPDEQGLSGKIIVEFIVEQDGSITNIVVIQDIGFGSGNEAVRVFTKCPKWLPGKKAGKAVRTLYRLPITIKTA